MRGLEKQCQALALQVELVARAANEVGDEPVPSHILDSLLASRNVLQEAIDVAMRTSPLMPPNEVSNVGPQPTEPSPKTPKSRQLRPLQSIDALKGAAIKGAQKAKTGAGAASRAVDGAVGQVKNSAKKIAVTASSSGIAQYGAGIGASIGSKFSKKVQEIDGTVQHVYESGAQLVENVGEAAHRFMMSEEEIKNATSAFNLLDLNSNGELTSEEVVEALANMGFEHDYSEVADLINSVDDDKNGSVTLHEWLDIVHVAKIKHHDSEVLQKKLDKFAVVGSSRYLIHPLSNFSMLWDGVVACLLFTTLITIPLCLGFRQFDNWAEVRAMNLVIDLSFLFDVLVNFNKGLISDDDVIILDRRIIIRTYLTGWFLPDLVSSIPFDVLLAKGDGSDDGGAAIGVAKSTKAIKLLRLLKLAKLIRLLRVARLFQVIALGFQMLEDSHLRIRVSDNFAKMSKLAFFLILMSHWLACVNWSIAENYNYPEVSMWGVGMGCGVWYVGCGVWSVACGVW
jgi:hypothetical protein